MKILKISLYLIVLLLTISGGTFSIIDRTIFAQGVFEDGEELYYEVYYSFINIGWAKFNTERVAGKSNYYVTRAKLKSNDGLPLVNVDYEFTSEIEVAGGQIKPYKFTAYQFIDNNKKITITHDFNYDSHFVYIKKVGLDGSVEVEKKIYTYLWYQDGLSIFYYARANAGRNFWGNVPVVMHVDTALMMVNSNDKKNGASIDEVDYDIASFFMDGFSYFKAVFGLTGDFSGWFSADDAKIPLKAKLEVEIGNITLELKSWKRKSWQPPKFN